MALSKSAAQLTPKTTPITIYESSHLYFDVTTGGSRGGGQPPVISGLKCSKFFTVLQLWGGSGDRWFFWKSHNNGQPGKKMKLGVRDKKWKRRKITLKNGEKALKMHLYGLWPLLPQTYLSGKKMNLKKREGKIIKIHNINPCLKFKSPPPP